MLFDSSNEQFKLAWHYVNDTLRHVYLTGKAGTGKTTFLRYLKQNSSKNMMIVAPTGVAAINAGGVTMHSLFQLPFKPFVAHIPQGFSRNEYVVDVHNLLKNIKMNDRKRKLLQELELLVIDEVSMMRADHLEAIHFILKSVRKKQEAFGGVQLLFIGDLYQLPPVVVDAEREVFEFYYRSPYFFDAPIMEHMNPLYIELKQVYRQKDPRFIHLLNRVRNNDMSLDDFNTLHECYAPDFEPGREKYITVTSHNHKAEAINVQELHHLQTPKFSYEGMIDGNFGDKQLPTDRILVLKEGAQVMFIRNDSNPIKRYYNGKLATVVSLNKEEITVEFPGESELFIVPLEVWENITYELNEKKNVIEEQVIGTFTQFPLRLAWAITIHKSQGLTFERAIIDAGASFAPGQVYVALSRCTSMEGLKLRSEIKSGAIMLDPRIQDFAQREVPDEDLKLALHEEQKIYQLEKFRRLFDFDNLIQSAHEFYKFSTENKTFGKEKEILQTITQVKDQLENLSGTAKKFLPEIQQLLFTEQDDRVIDRCEKALNYFSKSMFNDIVLPLKKIRDALANRKGVKTFEQTLADFQEEIWRKAERLHKTAYKGRMIEINKDHLSIPIEVLSSAVQANSNEALPKKKKKSPTDPPKPKPTKLDSAKQSLAYFIAGHAIQDIARLRNLAPSTIEGHLFTFIDSGELSEFEFISLNEIEEIKTLKWSEEDFGLKDLFIALEGKYSYFQLRIALSIIKKENAPHAEPLKETKN